MCVGEAQPPQRPEQTRGGVLRPPQEPQVPELLPFAVLLPKADPRAAEVTGTDRSRSIVRGSSQGLASDVGVERLAGDVRFLSIARAPSAADASGSGYRTVLLDIKGPPPVRRARPYAPGPPSAIRSRRAVSVRASSRASSTGEGRASRFAVAHGSAPLAAREAQVRRTRMTVSSRRET